MLETRDAGKELDEKVKRYLKENPEIQKSMDVFGMAIEDYKSAIAALDNRPIETSSSTTQII